jgi:hypothetical protein
MLAVGGKTTDSVQFPINPDLSATAVWHALPGESSSSDAGEKWQKNGC